MSTKSAGQTAFEREFNKMADHADDSQLRGGQEMQPISDTVIISRSERDQLRVDLSNAREEIIRLEQQMEISEHVTKTASAHLRAQLRQTQGGRLTVTGKEFYQARYPSLTTETWEELGETSHAFWEAAAVRLNMLLDYRIASPWTAITGPETLTKKPAEGTMHAFTNGRGHYWYTAWDNIKGATYWMPIPSLPTPETVGYNIPTDEQ